jgi:hypothetical protein
MHMSIADSFSCCGQVSQIDVNGQRLTSSAGNHDDGLQEVDGSLITAGGIGDSFSNPVDPFSTNDSGDDELYDLHSFVSQGDQFLTIRTQNATNDDNIFFLGLHSSVAADITPEPSSGLIAIVLFPGLFALRRRASR